MNKITFKEVIVDQSLTEDAICNNKMPGFKEDYLLLHYLIKKYQPKSFLEIGTNVGTGTNIICNAIGRGARVYSLDLPEVNKDLSKQYPGRKQIGMFCKKSYIQLYGDSLTYNFIKECKCGVEGYGIEGAYIDGEHDYIHVKVETEKILVFEPKIIIYHDSDMEEVFQAIEDTFAAYHIQDGIKNYDLFRVVDTRITFAVRRD